MGFSSKHRICNQVCFNDIFANGTTLTATGFKLFWNINEVVFPRITIRVPKKEISGAVERNRVKRQLREVFRRFKPRAIPVFDYVIICKHRLLSYSNQKIRTSPNDGVK